MIVAVSAKFITTVPELPVLVGELEVLVDVAKKDLAPIWMARASQGMIKAEKVPKEDTA